MATPTFYPEQNTPHALDPIERSLIKICGRLYDLVVATLAFYPEDCTPAPFDPVERSLKKINALLNALGGGGGAVNYGGNGSPEGVITANVNSIYVQWDNPGSLWTKVSGVGNTGWALNV